MPQLAPIIDTDAGINMTIHIACSSEEELDGHLKALATKARKAFRKNPELTEVRFEENNCAGTHDAVIIAIPE